MSEYEDMNHIDGETPAVAEPVEEVKPVAETEPAAASGEETPAEVVVEDPPHKKPGSQREREKRIAVEAENRVLREQLAGGKPVEAPKPQGKPTADQFESHEEWIEALTDWKTDQKIQAREAEKAKTDAVNSWEAKKEAAREKYEDLDEVLDSANASPVVLQALLEAETGVDLAYHLATHPKELKEINAMGTRAAIHALDALEAKLTAPPQKQISKAPAPVTPLPSSASAPPVVQSKYEDF
jgi:hypothetical protein